MQLEVILCVGEYGSLGDCGSQVTRKHQTMQLSGTKDKWLSNLPNTCANAAAVRDLHFVFAGRNGLVTCVDYLMRRLQTSEIMQTPRTLPYFAPNTHHKPPYLAP